MRKIAALLAALGFAGAAYAAIFAIGRNNAGGMMVLTDEKCNGSGGRVAYTELKDYPTLFGCWVYDGLMIHVRWNDGDVRSYPTDMWVIPNKGKDL